VIELTNMLYVSGSKVRNTVCDGLYHRLNPVAGLCHGVLVEVAHHFFDPHHKGGNNVVMSFIDM
jgi:hypothetical protein